MKFMMTNNLIVILLFMIQLSVAQNKQGNIVEYFGKEKVEEINEGEVFHIFKEGLILGGNRFPFSDGSISTNPLFARILQNGESGITEGKKEDSELMGTAAVWEKISVNEKNEFQKRSIRGGGYLYLQYKSTVAEIVIFEASGHTDIIINGLPHEGDYYDYGWSLIPVQLQKGKNEFILRGGRFPRLRARILKVEKPVQLTTRDMTLPDIIKEESNPLKGAIRVINARNKWFKTGHIICRIGKDEIRSKLPDISHMNIQKVAFDIPSPDGHKDQEEIKPLVILVDKSGNTLSTDTLALKVKSKFKHHKRTFISQIDESVQYYSVAPSSDPDIENPAMFLSVHGASVEAVNQARAYKQKDWGHLVAPTNRRPFGYAWENWGRLDALEVLAHAENLFGTDPKRTYLTGHSMGGHGTWQLGVTYPDRFAAIAPCAGYADLQNYRRSFRRMLNNISDEQAKRFGMDKEMLLKAIEAREAKNKQFTELDSMIRRSGNPGRTLKLKKNYLHHGVFILHGEKDNVVPTEQARKMRAELGKFHPDFTYYEYPDGTHWYGDHSVDWPPIFDFFKARTLKDSEKLKNYEFYTASPGVSSKSHFISILQQTIPLEISSFEFNQEKGSKLTTQNANIISIDIQKMGGKADTIMIDGQELIFTATDGLVYLKNIDEKWQRTGAPSLKEKGPHRNGGFKDAFTNNVVLVYATNGTKSENEWYYNRARFDAEKFYYLGNGSLELIKDRDFSPTDYKDRNVVLYGNRNNNKAWKKLLKKCPVQVSKNKFQIADTELNGDHWAAYFIYPRSDSDRASIGVVTATGESGMKTAFGNDYLGRPAYPDLLIFDKKMMSDGISGVKCAGFFDNNWSVDNGDFVWREEN